MSYGIMAGTCDADGWADMKVVDCALPIDVAMTLYHATIATGAHDEVSMTSHLDGRVICTWEREPSSDEYDALALMRDDLADAERVARDAAGCMLGLDDPMSAAYGVKTTLIRECYCSYCASERAEAPRAWDALIDAR